jgi:hypothetical protein
MKRCSVVLSCALALSACSLLKPKPAPVAPPVPSGAPGGVAVERIAFQAGVSTATVERLARQHACTGGVGAGLVTPPGPVEVYRMACDNGSVFMARCELRQCAPMAPPK